jgi:cytochrome c-type biogenesis protein CcmH/NrfF
MVDKNDPLGTKNLLIKSTEITTDMAINKFRELARGGEKWEAIKSQAQRYMVAVYGERIWYSAPELEPNLLVQWIRALAEGNTDWANQLMDRIEEMAEEQKVTYQDEDYNKGQHADPMDI